MYLRNFSLTEDLQYLWLRSVFNQYFDDCLVSFEQQDDNFFRRSTQPFIRLMLIKRVQGIPEDLVVESKLSPDSGSVALNQFNHIYKKVHKVFF